MIEAAVEANKGKHPGYYLVPLLGGRGSNQPPQGLLPLLLGWGWHHGGFVVPIGLAKE